MKTPEIRINFAWLLFYGESQTVAEANTFKLESYDYYDKKTVEYRKAWKKHEKIIIAGLQSALGVDFYKPVIDVSCTPYFVPKSDPLIMNFKESPDQFVDVLMHELCHVLLTDNNVHQSNGDNPKMDLIAVWKKIFNGQEDLNVLAHIPVHALCKYVYVDVLKEPSRLRRDKKAVEEWDDSGAYKTSWAYVDSHDYKNIIEELRQSYRQA
jgi:hypothetical protein